MTSRQQGRKGRKDVMVVLFGGRRDGAVRSPAPGPHDARRERWNKVVLITKGSLTRRGSKEA
jgi:hypothetical protein